MRSSFFLREALESLRRNWVMTIASVLTVVIAMGILGLVLVFDKNLNQGTTSLKNRVIVEVFIKKDATPEQEKALGQKITGMPEVKSAEYISEKQALEDFRKRLGANADQILSNLPTNPLPASYRIQVKDASQVDAVAQRFFDDPTVDNDPGTTNGVKYAKQTVRKMLGTIGLVEKGMWAITIVLAVAAVLLISTTVRLSIFARRREIEIMQLVGATGWFVRWPFVLEGFITGCLGSLIAALGVLGLNWLVTNWVNSSDVKFLNVSVYPVWVQSGPWPLGLLPTLILIGALLGAIGSIISMRRYLRV